MFQSFQRTLLLGRIAMQGETNMGVFIIGGNMDLGDCRRTDARIGKLVTDQLVEFFANDLSDALVTMGVHALRITLQGGGNNAADRLPAAKYSEMNAFSRSANCTDRRRFTHR